MTGFLLVTITNYLLEDLTGKIVEKINMNAFSDDRHGPAMKFHRLGIENVKFIIFGNIFTLISQPRNVKIKFSQWN